MRLYLRFSRFLRDIVQISCQHLCACNIILLVQFFINAMRSIRTTTHWQQQDIFLERLLKRQCYRDTASLTGQIRVSVPGVLDGLGGSIKIPMMWTGYPPLSVMQTFELQGVFRFELGKFSLDVLFSQFSDFF